jgi:hypothetical protein
VNRGDIVSQKKLSADQKIIIETFLDEEKVDLQSLSEFLISFLGDLQTSENKGRRIIFSFLN